MSTNNDAFDEMQRNMRGDDAHDSVAVLPMLPVAAWYRNWPGNLYTAEQMHAYAIAALQAQQGAPQGGDHREDDRRRFPDPDFNRWLDEGVSDAGHTVYDYIGGHESIAAAWAGWDVRPHYTTRPQVPEQPVPATGPIYCTSEPYAIGTYTAPPEHAESCACLRSGDCECNCHLAYGFATAEDMEEADERDRLALATPSPVEAQRVAWRYLKQLSATAWVWTRWLDMDELHHYGPDGNLVAGPHPDWKIEYAYSAAPAPSAPPVGVEGWSGEVECCDAKGMWLVMADDCPLVPGQKVTVRFAATAAVSAGDAKDGANG